MSGFNVTAKDGETRIRGDAEGLRLLRDIIYKAMEAGWAEIVSDDDDGGKVHVECVQEWRPV